MTDEPSGDLRARIVALERGHQTHGEEISRLKDWRIQRDIETARKDEAWKNMDEKLGRVEKAIDKINNNISWLLKLLVGGILMGVVAYLLAGGFKVP